MVLRLEGFHTVVCRKGVGNNAPYFVRVVQHCVTSGNVVVYQEYYRAKLQFVCKTILKVEMAIVCSHTVQLQ